MACQGRASEHVKESTSIADVGLYNIAKSRGVKGRSTMTKRELFVALR